MHTNILKLEKSTYVLQSLFSICALLFLHSIFQGYSLDIFGGFPLCEALVHVL